MNGRQLAMVWALALAVAPGCAKDTGSQISTSAGRRDNTAVELKRVKYDELVSAVKSNKGKIVVMDVWGEF
jgi:hypothetical protein